MSESPAPIGSGLKPIYRVVETGEIGQLIPCPCDDPIILEFKDGIRDAFFLRELGPTTHPITALYPTCIEEVVGFNCTRPLMWQLSQLKQVALESLGIAERIPVERTWVAWQLTELGRVEGEEIIRGL